MANRFLDRNMGQIIASTNNAINTIMQLRKLRWDYAIEKARLKTQMDNEQDRRNWQMNLEMFRQEKADERMREQVQLTQQQQLLNAKANVEKQYADIIRAYGTIPGLDEAKAKAMEATTPEDVYKSFNIQGLTRGIISSIYSAKLSQPAMVSAKMLKGMVSGIELPQELKNQINSWDDTQLIPATTANAIIRSAFSKSNIVTRVNVKDLKTDSVYKIINMLESYEKQHKPGAIKQVIEGTGLHDYKTPEFDQAHALRVNLISALNEYNDALQKGDTQAAQDAKVKLAQLMNIGTSFLNNAYINKKTDSNPVPEPTPEQQPKPEVNNDLLKRINEANKRWELMHKSP